MAMRLHMTKTTNKFHSPDAWSVDKRLLLPDHVTSRQSDFPAAKLPRDNPYGKVFED